MCYNFVGFRSSPPLTLSTASACRHKFGHSSQFFKLCFYELIVHDIYFVLHMPIGLLYWYKIVIKVYLGLWRWVREMKVYLGLWRWVREMKEILKDVWQSQLPVSSWALLLLFFFFKPFCTRKLHKHLCLLGELLWIPSLLRKELLMGGLLCCQFCCRHRVTWDA